MAVFTIGDDSIAGGAPTGGEVGGASNLTTVGAIPYVSASGVLNQDTPGLHWDATNERLGVGTASPAYAIDIGGSALTARFYDQTATTGSTSVVIRAGAGQSGNLTTWQNAAGTTLSQINVSGQYGVISGGALKSVIFSSVSLASDSNLRWNSTTDLAGGATDVAIARNAAGVLEVNNGSAGTFRDLRLRNPIVSTSTPASATATGTTGTVAWDTSYIYICTATDTWKRVAIATW